MKLTDSTVKTLGLAAIGLAGVYMVSKLAGLHKAGQQLLAPIAEGISGIYDSVRFAGERVEATQPGVILRLKDFENEVIKPVPFEAQSTLHPDNPAIMQMAFTPSGQLREPYWSLMLQSDVLLIKPDGTIERS